MTLRISSLDLVGTGLFVIAIALTIGDGPEDVRVGVWVAFALVIFWQGVALLRGAS